MIGHQWAVDLLRGHIRAQRVRHAYLFTGPQGIGRRTLALRFAQALNCPQPPAPGVPCGTCRVCRQIEAGHHPDLFIVQAEREGGTLKVDQVRELQRQLALAPYEATYRIALLLRFEEAHPSAANALLKTLEEPPERVVLLLTAESAEGLLPTIVSRCEVIRLRPVPPQPLAQALEAHHQADPEQAALLAHLAHGRPGLALRWLRDPTALQQREEHLQALEQLLSADLIARFGFAEQLTKPRDQAVARLRPLLQTWLDLWRDVLLHCADPTLPLANRDRRALIEALAQHLSLAQVQAVVERLVQSLTDLDHHLNPRLLLEVILLDLPRLPAVPSGR